MDTTPAVWVALESAESPWWQSLYDVGSWLAFLFAEWRWEETEEESRNWMLWLVLPLALVLLWRLARRQRILRGAGEDDAAHARRIRLGMDSDFYAVERRLLAQGHRREPGESTRAWVARLAETGAVPGAAELLRDLLPLHYRYRFDPAGLDPEARRRRRLPPRRRESCRGPSRILRRSTRASASPFQAIGRG